MAMSQMQQMNGMGAPPMMPAQGGKKKTFEAELNNIKMSKHEFAFMDSDDIFLERNS